MVELEKDFSAEENFFGEVDEVVKVLRVNRFPTCDVSDCKDKFKYQEYCLGSFDSRICPARRT